MGKTNQRSIMLSLLILLAVFFLSNPAGLPASVRADENSKNPSEMGIVSLKSIKELKQASKEYEFVYVILTVEQESDDAIRKTVLSAAQGADKEKQIGLFEISKRTDGYKRFVRQHKVKELPAVVAMNGSGDVEMVQGEISKEKLVEARAKVSGAKKKLRCPMSEGKPCDPKACGKEKGK
jgi:hypothetical protein